MQEYTLGLSPCPNDTFIFHALLHNLVPFSKGRLRPVMADVEALNRRVRKGELDFSKISLGAYAACAHQYRILSAGAALGFGCGPIVVARKDIDLATPQYGCVAIPGKMTTANLLLSLTGKFLGERREMLFSDIIPCVEKGKVDFGLIIHEGRFTYADHGLVALLDLGKWWEELYHVPLPLGAIVVRRDIALDTAKAMESAIADSLDYAWKNPSASLPYIKSNAQELADNVIAAHIKTFVTPFSRNLGEEGRRAISALVGAAHAKTEDSIPSTEFFLP